MTLEWNDDELIAEVIAVNMEAMEKATIFVQGKAKEIAGGPGTGRLYKRKNGASHRASAPGAPPARDSGILVTSVSYETGRKGLTLIGSVGPDPDKIKARKPRVDPDYGLYLEEGVKFKKKKGGIAKRPWLKPALIKSRNKIDSIFKKANRRIT